MSSEDTEYYRARAEVQRTMAKSAPRKNMAEIHEELARQYDALAESPELRPKLSIVY